MTAVGLYDCTVKSLQIRMTENNILSRRGRTTRQPGEAADNLRA